MSATLHEKREDFIAAEVFELQYLEDPVADAVSLPGCTLGLGFRGLGFRA